MGTMTSQIPSLTVGYWTVYSGADQRKHQNSASLAFVQGINRWPVNSRTKAQLRGRFFHLMTPSSTMASLAYLRCLRRDLSALPAAMAAAHSGLDYVATSQRMLAYVSHYMPI